MIWYPWYPRAAAFLAKSRTESIITWTQHYNHYRMPEGPTPLSPQYSFQIWFKSLFPVHYFHPVVFNWLSYKPSKWCNIIPQARSENIPQYLWFDQPIYPQTKSREPLIHLFSQSSADYCATRSSEQPEQPVDCGSFQSVWGRAKTKGAANLWQ